MKKILYILLVLMLLSLSACNDSTTISAPSNSPIEYITLVDMNTPVSFKLSDFNLSNGNYTISLNDTQRLSFTGGEIVKNITDIYQDISVSFNFNNPILQGNELSISISQNNEEVKKIYFVLPVQPNNPNALLTCSLPINSNVFNISALSYEKAGYEVMRNSNDKIVDIRKTYSKNEIVKNEDSIYIIGLYNNHNNIVRLYAGDYNSPDYVQYISIKTQDISTVYENVNLNYEIKQADYSKVDKGFLLLPGHYFTYLHLVDKHGNIRGVYDKSLTKTSFVTKYINNNLVSDNVNSFTITNLIGNNLIDIPYSFQIDGQQVSYTGHHDFILLNSGKYKGMYAILVNKAGEPTIEDHIIIIEVDENNNSARLVKEIDFRNYLPSELYQRLPYTTTGQKDWLHTNSIEHDENDDSLVVSGRSQGVIKITLPENNGVIQAGKDDIELKWLLTPHIGFSMSDSINILDKLLKPLDRLGNEITDEQIINGYQAHEDFEWNYGQHTALLRDGYLIMFDNGDGRYNKATNDLIEIDGSRKKFSRYVAYKINETDMTVQQVFSYGKDRPELYSKVKSKVDTLVNGNFFMFSSHQKRNTSDTRFSTYTEIDRNNNIVLQIEVRQDNMETPLDAPTYRMYQINPFDYVDIEY